MNKIIVIIFLLNNLIFSQKNYFVTKSGDGNFRTISELNNFQFNAGDIVSFKSGEQFSDAILKCQTGVTYNTYGGNVKAILGDYDGKGFYKTVSIDNGGVTLENLKFYSNGEIRDPNSPKYTMIIEYTVGGWTLRNCELIGGSWGHKPWFVGIHSKTGGINKPINITYNEIHDMNIGIKVVQPYNFNISFNKMYNFWRYDAFMDRGGYAIGTGGTFDGDTWDADYTLHIHHNEIFNFEYVALGVGNSRMLIEYNNIHSNLDERIYRGGVKHGSIGKIFDNTGVSLGGLGTVFRYNYIHNLVRRGETNHTYGKQTNEMIDAQTFTVKSTNNGNERAIYEYSVYENANDFGDHFGDEPGESPDAIISGLGYSNIWIHNNIFENCSNKLFSRSAIVKNGYGPNNYRIDLPTYLVNNTILNCGYLDYITGDNGFITTEWTMASDHFQINNIIDYTNTNARYAVYLKGNNSSDEGKIFFDYNIYTKQSGFVTKAPIPGENKAVFDRDGKGNKLTGANEQYLKNPNWNNVSATFFAPNIGINGTDIPDVRIIEGGSAHNKGMPYNQIGDNFTVKGQKHQKGKDPTGRNFAFDILGNLRSTNDIGAVGAITGITIDNPQSSSMIPKIIVQPGNISAITGNDITLTLTATCDEPIGYQWWRSPFVNVIESKITNNEKYSGATTNTLTIRNISASDAEVNYVCEVYNINDHANLWVNSNPISLVISQSSGSTEGNTLKIYLEAAYKNGQMETTLNSAKLFPVVQPYNSAPWNLHNNVEITEIKSNYVDWIIVELRKELSQATYSKPAILTSEGKVLNPNGTNFSFENIENDQYYISIFHRNHLNVISSEKVDIRKDEPLNYNFTDSSSKALGVNSLTDIGDGIFGMYAGDADANGVINNLDFGNVANHILNKGYLNNDLDMNGIINVLDYNKINKNILKKAYYEK